MLPNVGRALDGWMKKRTINYISKTVVNHLVVETPTVITAFFHAQPTPSEKVARKPEEQRNWNWWTIWIKGTSVVLKIDDVITVDGRNYKVNEIVWQKNNAYDYSSYECIEDFV